MTAHPHIQDILVAACLAGAVACLLALLAPVAWDSVRRWLSETAICRILSAAFVVGFVLYGGSKVRFTFDGGIKNGASPSWASNDTVFVSWQRDTSSIIVPLTAAVYIDYRPAGATNEEWGLLAQSVVGNWSWTGNVPNATNYDYSIWAEYIPPEPVHTNGVWIYKAMTGRDGRHTIPLRSRIEVGGKAISTPKEKRKDEGNDTL